MLLTQIAIVPLDRGDIDLDELLNLAATIQVQVHRDLGPLWGVHAAVSPFRSLKEVPAGYWPVAITKKVVSVDGFHFTMRGLPFGVVKQSNELSVALSHEVTEMLVDPYGQRTVSGPRLDDSGDSYVEYFVEVCDPCQQEPYEVNGVRVSDFVLPGYYDMNHSRPQHYSFTGQVTEPRQVRPGGYVSYREPFPNGNVYQVFALPSDPTDDQIESWENEGMEVTSAENPGLHDSKLTITQLPSSPTRAWRELMAALTAPRTDPEAASQGLSPAVNDDFAAEFKRNVTSLAKAMQAKKPPPSVRDVLSLMQDLIEGSDLEAFHGEPETRRKTLERIGVPLKTPKRRDETADDMKDRYTKVVAYLEQQERLSGIFGPDIDPGLSFWMFMLMP
jgi:hypothetical protein